MSITSRINEMSSHIEQAYDELQGLGADLTGIDKNIDNIAQVLDDIYDSMPQVSDEGTSLTLDDTRVGKIKSTLKGNTSQTTYSGKNLLPNERATTTENGITITKYDDGTYKVNGTASADVSLAINENTFISMSGTWRMLGCPSGGSASTYMLSAYVGYWGTASPNIDTGNGTNITYTGNVKVRFYIKSGTTCNNLIFKPMLTTDTTATINNFEPYTGGQASPNPDYPQEVNVVSGDNTINICGKNLFDNIIDVDTFKARCSLSYENGEIVMSTTGSDAYFGNAVNTGGNWTSSVGKLIIVEPNTSYYLKVTNNIISKNFITFYDKDLVSLGATYLNASSKLITSPSNARYCNLRIGYNDSVSGGVYKFNIQLEKGTSASNYEPYQGNTYNIDLPEGMELCKIGSYQDYFYKDNGNWYKYGAIGEVVFTGADSETWNIDNAVQRTVYTGISTLIKSPTNNDTQLSAFTNLLQTKSFNEVYSSKLQGISCSTGGNLSLHINGVTDTGSLTLESWKNWLSSNNIILYYILATPTTTQITDTNLINQLNALEQAQSKENQTNISQVNNDLPFIISASALKEWSV